MSVASRSVGSALSRVDGRLKVTGQARYAYEEPVEGVAYAAAVTATIAAGEIDAIDPERALALPGVLAVISHDNAPRLGETDDGELLLFQSDTVHYRGQIVAAVVAETLEAAREAAAACASTTRRASTTSSCRSTTPASTSPTRSTRRSPPTPSRATPRRRSRRAEVVVDETYVTAPIHNNAMEPHATLAVWEGGDLLLHDSIQGTWGARRIARPGVRHPPRAGARRRPARRRRLRLQGHAAAAIGARRHRRARSSSGRSRSRSRASRCSPASATARRRSSASGSARRRDGRLTAIAHEAFEQTSTVREFAEQTCDAHADDVRGARPPHAPPARRARRPHAVVDARARRVPGHVRARVGDRRARGRVRHRPDRAADPQRARPRPREGHPVLLAQPRRLPARGRRALRLGRPRPDAGRARTAAG